LNQAPGYCGRICAAPGGGRRMGIVMGMGMDIE
jgi:hypothetical protein